MAKETRTVINPKYVSNVLIWYAVTVAYLSAVSAIYCQTGNNIDASAYCLGITAILIGGFCWKDWADWNDQKDREN